MGGFRGGNTRDSGKWSSAQRASFWRTINVSDRPQKNPGPQNTQHPERERKKVQVEQEIETSELRILNEAVINLFDMKEISGTKEILTEIRRLKNGS